MNFVFSKTAGAEQFKILNNRNNPSSTTKLNVKILLINSPAYP